MSAAKDPASPRHWKALADQGAAPLSEQARMRARARFLARATEPPKQKISARAWWLAAAAAVLLAAPGVWRASQRGVEQPLALVAQTPESIKFSDGTELQPSAASSVQLGAVGNEGATVHLERGHMHVHVVHRTRRTSWHVLAGPYDVHVVGTQFDVSWQPESQLFLLKMQEGEVQIDGCGLHAKRVRGTEQLALDCAPSPTRASEPQASSSAFTALDAAPATDAAPKAAATVRANPRADEQQDHCDALRLQNADDEARNCYAQLKVAGAARALIQFHLAGLDRKLGQLQRAAVEAEEAERGATGTLREDALWLRMAIAKQASNPSAIDTLTDKYLQLYPQGRYVTQARALKAKP